MSTLLIVDVQNDFCPGGSLATERGDAVAAAAADLVASGNYDQILATQDWHIDPGAHFSENPDFQDSWPVHCVAGSVGAQMHPELVRTPIDEFFRKGRYEAAYSGFEGESDEGASLASWLREHDISGFDIVGIATDHCVRATVLDGLREGFDIRVLSSLCSPVDRERGEAALQEMANAGAEVA